MMPIASPLRTGPALQAGQSTLEFVVLALVLVPLFVLVPLLEIAPEATIPGRGRAADWLAVCQDQSLARLQPPAATANA